jgi:predicted histone-like DNA-binding protein
MKFRVIERHMPNNPSAPKKHYAIIVRPANVGLKALAKRIAEISPVNELDTETVLFTFVRVIPEFLKQGATIELGDFGRLMVSIHSEGVETPEDFTKAMIKKSKVSFQPGVSIKKEMKTVDYQKAEEKKSK